MTLGEAKALLRAWFRALADAADGLPRRSLDVLVLGPGTPSLRLDSPTEAAVLARAGSLEPYERVAAAYARLSPVHQEVLWLLYGLNTTFRDARTRLGVKHNEMVRLMDRALAAFITALGQRVTEELERGA